MLFCKDHIDGDDNNSDGGVNDDGDGDYLSIGGSLSCSASRPRDLVSHHRLCLCGDYVHFFLCANFCIFLIHHLLTSIYWTCMQESFADVPIFEWIHHPTLQWPRITFLHPRMEISFLIFKIILSSDDICPFFVVKVVQYFRCKIQWAVHNGGGGCAPHGRSCLKKLFLLAQLETCLAGEAREEGGHGGALGLKSNPQN